MNTTPSEAKRGPGRPRNDENREVTRRRRKASGETTGGRLGVNPALLDHDKFAYRWINDDPGRLVMKTQHDDWDLVPNAGEKEDSTDLGSMVSIVVGTTPEGQAKRAYLARKMKTFYDQDKAAEQAALDEQLAQLRRGLSKDGEAQSDYVPSGGIRIG